MTVSDTLFPMLEPPPPPAGPAGPALFLTLDYHGRGVRMVGTVDRPEWVAADVCGLLTIANPRSALADFDDDEKGVGTVDTPGGPQRVATVTEAGVYRLAIVSRKPEARTFRRWLFGDVLPSIRRHGCYPPPPPAGPPQALGAAINPGTTLIPLKAVPSLPWLPRRPSVDTVYEWHRYGRRGIHLQTIRSGGQLFTSPAEVFIFLTRIASPNPRPDAPVTLTLNMNGGSGGAVLNALSLPSS